MKTLFFPDTELGVFRLINSLPKKFSVNCLLNEIHLVQYIERRSFHVGYNFFFSKIFKIVFGICLTPNLSKYATSSFLIWKSIQCVPLEPYLLILSHMPNNLVRLMSH